jgi:WD40 repeat protein
MTEAGGSGQNDGGATPGRATDRMPDRMKVFVSYSRDDLAFADQLVMALDDMGYEPLIDRRAINPAEPWQDRLRALLTQCDTVVFVLTSGSLDSDACAWEVREARALGKRMIPVLPAPVEGLKVPAELSLLNYIHFYPERSVPNSGFYGGQKRLDQALKQDLVWLRQLTRLSERAVEWSLSKTDELLLLGRPLADAQAWTERIPKEQSVPPLVREYLNASEALEQRRNDEAQKGLAERERVLKAEKEAVDGRRKADSLLRWVSFASLAVGTLLIAGALVALWFAADNYVSSSERASLLGTRGAEEQADLGRPHALALALYADPAANATFVERWLRPDGYLPARTALVRTYTENRLLKFTTLSAGIYSGWPAKEGDKVLLGMSDGTANLVEVATGAVIKTFGVSGRWGVTACALTPDGRFAVAGYGDGKMKVWSTADGAEIGSFQFEGVSSMDVSRDGAMVVATGRSSDFRVWSLPDLKEIKVQRDDRFSGPGAVFAPDGASILNGGGGGELLSTPINGGATTELFKVHEDGVWRLVLSPDGTKILAASHGGEFRLWSMAGESLGRIQPEYKPSELPALDISDEGLLMFGSKDGRAAIWDMSPRWGEDDVPVMKLDGFTRDMGVVMFLPDGKALTASYSGELFLWRTADPPPSRTLDYSVIGASPAGDLVIAVSKDMSASVRELASGKVVRTLPKLDEEYQQSRVGIFSANGKTVAVPYSDSLLQVGPTASTASPVRISLAGSRVAAFALSPDGERLAVSDETGGVTLFAAADGKEQGKLKGDKPVSALAFSNEGDRLAAGDIEGAVKLWRLETMSVVASHEQPSGVTRLGFSTDGSKILAASYESWAMARSLATGVSTGAVPVRDEMEVAAFHSEGKETRAILMTWDDVAVWSLEGGKLLTIRPPGSIEAAFFADGGRRVLLTDEFTTHVYDMPAIAFEPAEKQVEMACQLMDRNGLRERPIAVDSLPVHPCDQVWRKSGPATLR